MKPGKGPMDCNLNCHFMRLLNSHYTIESDTNDRYFEDKHPTWIPIPAVINREDCEKK